MEIRVPNTEETIRIERTGQFQFKQVVTDLLINVVCDSIVAAKNYIEKTKYTRRCNINCSARDKRVHGNLCVQFLRQSIT